MLPSEDGAIFPHRPASLAEEHEIFGTLANAIYRSLKVSKLEHEAPKLELDALESKHEAFCCAN